MRPNDEAIDRANRDLENTDHRNPRNWRSPIRPRNLDADFVLNYNGQDVFATPSANLAAVFQVLEGSSARSHHASPAATEGHLGLPRPVESSLDTTPRRL